MRSAAFLILMLAPLSLADTALDDAHIREEKTAGPTSHVVVWAIAHNKNKSRDIEITVTITTNQDSSVTTKKYVVPAGHDLRLGLVAATGNKLNFYYTLDSAEYVAEKTGNAELGTQNEERGTGNAQLGKPGCRPSQGRRSVLTPNPDPEP